MEGPVLAGDSGPLWRRPQCGSTPGAHAVSLKPKGLLGIWRTLQTAMVSLEKERGVGRSDV